MSLRMPDMVSSWGFRANNIWIFFEKSRCQPAYFSIRFHYYLKETDSPDHAIQTTNRTWGLRTEWCRFDCEGYKMAMNEIGCWLVQPNRITCQPFCGHGWQDGRHTLILDCGWRIRIGESEDPSRILILKNQIEFVLRMAVAWDQPAKHKRIWWPGPLWFVQPDTGSFYWNVWDGWQSMPFLTHKIIMI